MDFNERLQRAVNRGRQSLAEKTAEQQRAQLSEEEARQLHTRAQVELTDHIENCLRQLADQFPGFQFQTSLAAEGYGAKIHRDDVRRRGGRELAHEYSHLELQVRNYTASRIVEVVARGAIANKEVLTRSQYSPLSDLELEILRDQVDRWVLEYAEKFSAAGH